MPEPPSGFNPFPDYPVTRLQEDPADVRKHTIETPEIKEMGARVQEWGRQWTPAEPEAGKPRPITISIRGDYGSGKTHLLLYGISELAAQLKGYQPGFTVLRAASLEIDPLAFYGESLGPAIAAAGVPEMMQSMYAEAGKVISRGARLTEGGEKVLTDSPQAIFRLVRENLLDRNAVDEQLQKFLTDGGVASQDVRRALAALVWGETAGLAMSWLCGKPLTAEDRAQIKVAADVTEPETAAAILEGIAAVHVFLHRPLVFIVDELEHLVQYDLARKSRIATTWLKRLVELLAGQGTLIILSGHWDAWLGQTDLRDRLPGLRAIELPVLTAADVMKLAELTVRPGALSQEQAAAIVQATQGNRRKVLSLCRSLYEKSGGFESPLTPEDIRGIAEAITQKLTIDGAALALLGILEKLGLRAERDGQVRGVAFDLVGLRGNQPKVVVEIKHSVTQRQQVVEANEFLERAKDLPGVIGCFLSDGAVNPEILPLFAGSKLKRFVYDLNQRDVVARIMTDIVPLLSAAPADAREQKAERLSEQSAQLSERIVAAEKAQDPAEANRLKQERDAVEQQLAEMRDLYAKATTGLQDQLRLFEAQRAAEASAFQKRLDAAVSQLSSVREQAVVSLPPEPDDSAERSLFQDLTRPRPRAERLRFAFRSAEIVMLGLGLALVTVMLILGQAAPVEMTNYGYAVYRLVLWGMWGCLVVGAVWMVLRRLSQFDQREEYHTRLLHEIYVRRKSTSDLLRADNIIRSSFEENNILYARRRANQALAREFSDVYAYLAPDMVRSVEAASQPAPPMP